MKRNSLLITGMLLSIIYSLCFAVCLGVGVLSVIYFFVSDSITLINDLLLPVINPFMSYGKTVMLVFVALVIAYSIFILICSTRYIKYFNATNSVYNKKRTLLIVNLVFFIITFGIFCYLLISNILANNFVNNIIYNVCLIVILITHIIAIIFAIIGLKKYPKTYEEPVMEKPIQENQEINDYDQDESSVMLNSDINQDTPPQTKQNKSKQNPIQAPSIQPIYTAGLDGETEDKIEKELREASSAEQSKEIKKPEKNMESATTKKLIDAIGKLDEMRKNGEISMEEYTKLRTKMIQKFTK